MSKKRPVTLRKDRIMDVAQDLIQSRGINAFSYRDISRIIGIKTSSIHYHFPTKSFLCEQLSRRHRKTYLNLLKHIERINRTSRQRLEAYFQLYIQILAENKMCFGGMLAAESEALSPVMRRELRKFFRQSETWLTELLRTGNNSHEFNLITSPNLTARVLLSTIQGSMLSSRIFRSRKRLEEVREYWRIQLYGSN